MIVYERSTANYTPNNHERINTPQTVKIKQLIKSLIIFNTPEEIAQNVIWLSDPKLKDKFVKLGDRVYKIAHKDMNQNFVGLTKTIYNDASCSKLSFQQNDEQKIVLTISEEANFDYYKKIYLKFLTEEDEIPQTFDLKELRKNCVLQLSEKPLVVNQTVNIFHKGKTFTLKIIRADSEEYSLLNRSTKMHFDGEIHKIIKKIQVKGPLEVTYHIKLASPSDTKPALLNCDSLKTFLNRNLQGKSLSRKLNLRVQLSEQLFALEVKEIHCKNAKLKKKHRYGVCYEALGTIIHLFKTTISEIYPIRNKITYVTEAFFKINAFLPTQERLCYIDKQEILKKLYSIKEFYSYLPVTIALNNGMVNVCLTKPNESAPFSKCILQPTTNMTFDYDRSVVKLLDDVLPRRIPKLNIEISQLDSYQVQFYREQLNQIVRENTHHIFLHDRKKEITFQNKQLSLNIKLQNFNIARG